MKKILFILIALLALTVLPTLGQHPQKNPRTIYVTVENSKNVFVNGLKAEHFKVFENKVEQPIISFRTGESMSIGILFDVSDSIRNIFEKDVQDAAAGIAEAVLAQPAGNEYFLMGFNKKAVLLTDYTTEPELISAGLTRLSTIQKKGEGGATAVYDTVFDAIRKLSATRREKKVLIIYTDGFDGVSKRPRNEVIEFARDENVQIYTLTTKDAVTVDTPAPLNESVSRFSTPYAEFLRDLTYATGGVAHQVASTAPGNLDRDFETDKRTPFRRKIDLVFTAIGSQYTISYMPVDPSAGKGVKTVNVKLVLPPAIKEGKGVISLRFRKKFKVAE